MTCIVAVKRDGVVHMGADSAGVAGLDMWVRSDPKVFRNGRFVMGFTSSFRMGQLLMYSFTPPPIAEGCDLFEYMVKDFVRDVRICLKDGGFARKENEVESGGVFLVGVLGRIFRIDSDYQVGELNQDYAAIGCGEAAAIGCMHGLFVHGVELSPTSFLRSALMAAQEFSAGVRLPFIFVDTEPLSGTEKIPF